MQEHFSRFTSEKKKRLICQKINKSRRDEQNHFFIFLSFLRRRKMQLKTRFCNNKGRVQCDQKIRFFTVFGPL